MHRFRRGALPRRTRCGTMREGNEAVADAAALECRDLRNGPREAGAQACGSIARRATNGAPSEAAEPIPAPFIRGAFEGHRLRPSNAGI